MSQTLQHHHGRTTPYGRRRALLVAVLALLGATAFAAPRHLLNGEHRGYLGSNEDRSSLLDGQDRSYLSTDGWPLRGQGAYVLGNGRLAVSPHQQPVPIASVAKVMTAYVVLKHDPLRAGDSGPRFVVGHDDVVSRSVIGVVLGQRGGNLLTAGLSAARQLVDRMAPNAGAGTSSSSGSAGRPSPGQPGLGTPPGAYRRHIENHIRAGNTQLS